MEAFRWAPCFVTGLPRVDEQHRHLVDVINQLGERVMTAEGAQLATIEPIYNELAAYAVQHFREEEALMAERGVAVGHRRMHEEEHRRFLDEVQRLRATLDVAGSDATALKRSAERLLRFLADWLAYHILGCDQGLAQQLAGLDEGLTADEANARAWKARDPATATLLQSLDRLFRQVTERNRELSELNRTLEQRVAERTQSLAQANQLLEEMALTDALTGLANRRHAMRRLQQEWNLSSLAGVPLACIMMDADGFKTVNDHHGHDVGDAVLRELARELKETVRNDDTVCRLGGDEFLVICARTPLDGAARTAEKLRSKVAALRLPAAQRVWSGSLSVGVAARTAGMSGPEDLLKAGDEALYEAKRRGRNTVVVAPG